MPTLNWTISLRLDPTVESDEVTLQALLGVFPADNQPSVSSALALSHFAFYTTTLAVWIAAGVTDKLRDAIIEKAWGWLKGIRQALNKAHARGGLTFEISTLNTRVNISEDVLADPEASVRELIEVYADLRSLGCVEGAIRIMISRDPVQKAWVATIWPRSMPNDAEYFFYDSGTRRLTRHDSNGRARPKSGEGSTPASTH